MALRAIGATALEPISPPDVRVLERMPSLPAWVALRVASMRDECQRSPNDGKWRTMPTLPSHLMLSKIERAEIQRAIGVLIELCERTPERDVEFEGATLIVITKMMLALPSSQQNEAAAEATGEAFQVALDDLPTWAVAGAMRKWYRGECGLNERGDPFDYRWRPSPADLRRLAFIERYRVLGQVRTLERLLEAQPPQDVSEEHTANMRQQLANLAATLRKA